MKRFLTFLMIAASTPACGAAIYPMEGGGPAHENRVLSPTSIAVPMHTGWISSACSGDPKANPVVLPDIVVQTSQSIVRAMDRATGQGKWTWYSLGAGNMYSCPAYDPDRGLLYQTTEIGLTVALRVTDGQPMWHFFEGGVPGAYLWGSAVYANNRIYTGNSKSGLVCLDPDSHAVLWRHNFSRAQSSRTPACDNGEVYFCGTKGDLACLDAASGAVKWDINTGKCYSSAITLTPLYLYIMISSGKVECRLRTNGSLVWAFQTGSFSSSNLALCGQLVIASSDDRNVYALNQDTGQCVWHRAFVGNFARCAPFVACGIVFISGCTHQFYAIDARTSQTLWTYSNGADNSFVDWAEADGRLFVSDSNCRLYCFEPDIPSDPALCVCNLTANTFTPTPNWTATPTDSTTATRTASPSLTASPSASPTLTPTSTATPTPTPMPSISATLTASPTAGFSTPTKTPQKGECPDPGGHKCYVYPDPVKGGQAHVAYDMAEPGFADVKVYQSNGELASRVRDRCDEAGTHSTEVNVESCAPGVYFYKVDMEYDSGRKDRMEVKKFIVTR
jgi:outer membrane protein assembly factor BamB